MKLERVLPFARSLLQTAVKEGDYAVDATLGNGHDTCFLAEIVGDNGKVFDLIFKKRQLKAQQLV